jgi:23S rRNA (guanosine2251-2'-O)-methyltransferase
MSRRRIAGLHAAEFALEHNPDRIIAVWIHDRRQDQRLTGFLRRLADHGLTPQIAAKSRLDALAEGQPHQGVVLELKGSGEYGEPELRAAAASLGQRAFFLVLDQVQDPHNLGACLRTADAAGVQGVIVTKDNSVGLTATVAKAASGAVETVPIYRVANLARALDRLKAIGVWVIGAAGDAEKTIYQISFTGPLAVVMGAEGKGLRRLTQERCDDLVSIPMLGKVQSLNVSVAAGILLFEAIRQRR